MAVESPLTAIADAELIVNEIVDLMDTDSNDESDDGDCMVVD